jgi:beta-lactamase class D
MKSRLPLAIALLFAIVAFLAPANPPGAAPDWAAHFDEFSAVGTIVILDQRDGADTTLVHNEERAAVRFSPASTFKIPHALFALDAGIIRDEFQVIPWDGEFRGIASWNSDQDLRSSMRNSTVWVYSRIARELGREKEQEYLRRIPYGNEDTTGNLEDFWVEGALAISAHEQIAFLQKLYRNELPFKIEHQRLVKDIMIVEAGRDWILRAKTGWQGKMGWWVGWVEWPDGPVFFALNIDTPNRLEDLHKREAITRRILESLGALPE